MLINLSNHPSSKWSQAQQEAATEQYGEVEDLPFPNIDPSWTTQEIKALAQEYLAKVKTKQPQAVHLMGEMTFTYALVRLLQAAGISCVASTSERQVIEGDNGQKTVQFTFHQFRAYPQR